MGEKPIDFQAKKNAKQGSKKDCSKEQEIVICYVQGKDMDGESVYSYVAIPASSLADFNDAIHKGNVDVDEFGYRIVSGYGEPTEAVKRMMIEDYGFDHNSNHYPLK